MMDRIEGFRSGGLGIDQELQRTIEEKRERDQEMVVHMPHFAFDEFEKRLSEANGLSAQGKHIDARKALDSAHEYASEVRDDKLKQELLIRLEAAQRAFVRV